MPRGARTLAGAAYNYVKQQSVDVPKAQLLIRFDIKPTDKDNVYWKYPSGLQITWFGHLRMARGDNNRGITPLSLQGQRLVGQLGPHLRRAWSTESISYAPTTPKVSYPVLVNRDTYQSAVGYTARNLSDGITAGKSESDRLSGVPVRLQHHMVESLGEIGNDTSNLHLPTIFFTHGTTAENFGAYLKDCER